jgi:hypothetical protein
MTRRFVRSLKSAADAIAAAARAGTAVDNGRVPRREDLATLGIDPTAFRHIGR